ncbi:MAG: EamA family transporter [Deltaproteobacteria bacterium]|nr:EamA family transporter [Deltaproteobacteria bacterium]
MWVLLAVIAGCVQTVRNALSRSLTGKISPTLNSWARFSFNLPFSTSLVLVLILLNGAPTLTWRFYLYCTGTALAQLLANVALIKAFERANFAQSIVLHKLEVVFTAIIGMLFFAEAPSPTGWGGVVVCTLGMLLINLGRERGPEGWRRAVHIDAGAVFALACALGLVFAGFFLKTGVGYFVLANPRVGAGRFEAAAHTLFHTTWIEVVILSVALALRRPQEFRLVPGHWRRMMPLGMSAFVGSVCWFWAYSLTLVAYVKAVGQIEVVFAIALAIRVWREREVWQQLPGVALVTAGIALVVLG